MKDVVVAVVLGVVVTLVFLGILNTKSFFPPAKQIVIVPTVTVTPTPFLVPPTWESYTSEEYGFSIQYPPDVTHDTTSEGERFYKLGETQSAGTEMYDGISLIIKSGPLNGVPFSDFVTQKYEESANDPVEPKIGVRQPVSYSGMQGIEFSVDSLGLRKIVFLSIGDDRYLEIINGTVEPTTSNQNLVGITNQIMTTIKIPQISPSNL